MGLATVIRKTKIKERQQRGLDSSGKSTIVQRWLGEGVEDVSPTFGFSIKTKCTSSNQQIHIWDIGGQKTIRPFWSNYFEQTDAIIWVIDSSNISSFEECKRELENSILKDDRIYCSILLFIANKQDCEGALSTDTIYQILDLDRFKRNCVVKIIGCSAVDYQDNRVIEAFEWLIETVNKSQFKLF